MILIVAVALFAYFSYGSGNLEIQITDPPINWGAATQVYLNYSAIEIHRAQADNESGWFTIVDQSAWINLTRTLDVNQTLGFKSLQAGLYNLIRFRIFQALVTVSGVNLTASVPSGRLQVAITRGGITINTGQRAILLIELNIKVVGSIIEGFSIVVPDVRATPI